MLTLKLKIKSCSNTELMNQYISSYTGAFYKLYNNADLIEDSYFLNSIRSEFNLSVHELNSLIIDVKTKLNQYLTQQKKKTKQLKELESKLLILKSDSKKSRRFKFRTIQKIAYLKSTLDKNICFGGKDLLRKITKLKQEIQFSELTDIQKYEKQILVEKILSEYKSNRKLPFYIVGIATNNGNREVNFDLENQKITFKPNRKTKIEFEFYCGRNQQRILNQIQLQTELKLQPITVSISKDYIYLNYEESTLNGVGFDKNGLNSDKRNCISEIQIKQLYKTYINQHNDFLKSNKNSNRIGSIDLNPNYIGFSIVDYSSDENLIYEKKLKSQKIIYKTCFDLRDLNKKTGKSSTYNKKQNFKKTYEIVEIYKRIFESCRHFRVFKFAIEDLNFNPSKDKEIKGKEFNRLTKNIWNRTLQTNQIKKRCAINGIQLVLVNPMFSSLSGNLIYDYFDPISSSIEIGRRGFFKYIKGNKIHESVSRINRGKLNYLLRNQQDCYLLDKNIEKLNSWYKLNLEIKRKGIRYRNVEITSSLIFRNRRSKVRLIS